MGRRQGEVEAERLFGRHPRMSVEVPDDLLREDRQAVTLFPGFEQVARYALDLGSLVERRSRAGKQGTIVLEQTRRVDCIANHPEEIVKSSGCRAVGDRAL